MEMRAKALAETELRLKAQRAELDKQVYELAQAQSRLEEQQRTVFDKVAVTENQNESLQHRQEDLENFELELLQDKQKLQEEIQSLQAQQRDLASRQAVYNQQQLDFITRKNAFSSQQFELAEKINAYNEQAKILQEAQEKLEAEKKTFVLAQSVLEKRIQTFEEEKSAFETEKEKFQQTKEETERQHELIRQQIFQERLQLDQDGKRLQEPITPTPITTIPAPIAEPVPVSPTQDNTLNDVQTRAQADGIRIHTAGFANSAPSYPTRPAETTATRGYYNAGQTLFKSAFIIFCIVLFESLLVFFMKDYLGVSFVYPVVGFAGGFILFIVCSILFACGFKPIVRRKKNPSYIFTMSILFVITVIAVSMVAVYCKAPISEPAKLLSFVIIPVVYFLNMIFFVIFYRLFSLKNVTK